MKKIFFLGGNDAEMFQIKKRLSEAEAPFIDAHLGWGAKASAYQKQILEAAAAGQTPVLVELEIDIELPSVCLIVDHHGLSKGKSQSILQVLELIKKPASREDILIALNDEGYIPALKTAGASPEEISWVRALDRSCQGITPEQEKEGERAVQERQELPSGLIIVHCSHSKTAPIVDRIFEIQGDKQNLLIISEDGESNYFGSTEIIETIDVRFPGGWKGGLTTGKNAYWGGYVDQKKLAAFLKRLA